MGDENPTIGNSDVLTVMGPPKMVNGINGVSNGHSDGDKHRSSSSSNHHKSSSKDKHRDKDRDRHRDRDRDRDHKSSKSSHSSSSRDKHSSSSRDKDNDRDKDRHSSSHKSSSRDKDRKDRDKDKEKSSSSSSKDKDKSRDKDKDRDRTKSSDKDRERNHDKDKERSKDHKSSSDKDKDKSLSSSSRDKDKESRDKDKDRHKTTSSSSSSSRKHSSSHSSSRSKDKSRDKDRHSSSKSSSSRDKHRDRKDDIKTEIKTEIKEEPSSHEQLHNNSIGQYESHVKKQELKDEAPFEMSQASSCDYSMSQFRDDEESFKAKDPLAPDDNDESQDYGYNTTTAQNDDEEEDADMDDPDESNAPLQIDEDDDEDIPIAKRKVMVTGTYDEEDMPLTARKIQKTGLKQKKAKKKKREEIADDNDYDEDRPKQKKIKKEKKKETKVKKEEVVSPTKTGGRKKKEDAPQEVWKWWEEEKKQDGTKWNFLEHKGPVFAPPYIPLPSNITFEYDGKVMKLSEPAEEIACFYAKMLEHDYTSKKVFNDNFFKDWRKAMTSKEREKISNLKLCNFRKMHAYFTEQSERNKQRTKEEKAALKAENEALISEYGFCTIDGHKEKIGNFKIEPPGLFRGRGEHPKMGMVKNRIQPEDVLINCSKNSKIPVAPDGRKWKEVRHDNTVTWLASWNENVQGQVKYVMLNPSSKLKGEKDWQKYETARKLHRHIDKIRNTYREEWKSKEMRIRQRAVALYFIDKLALRAGNEKDEDQADTVGCCSLRVEHIELHKAMNGKENVVVFDFLGKDSIRYYNEVEVEKRVFKNLELFKENKKEGDDLFDRLNTVVMNEHLRELMEGLTAKVFRTYNASYTLQNQLNEMTDPNASLPEKLLAYNRANRAVAILCNHQRAVPKSHEKSMENLKEKIRAKREQLDDLEVETADAVKAAKRGSMKEKINADKKKKMLERCKEQLKKLELQETDRDENKTIALGTSKLNYLDPRISVAWCKKHDVPIDKIYNKTQRDKFRWAIDMATEDYVF